MSMLVQSQHVETNTNGFNNYSPISTLEQQYAHPVGRRLLLFVKATSSCTPTGGVQSLIHTSSTPKGMTRGSRDPFSTAEETEGEASEEIEVNGNGVPAEDDPFSFLGDTSNDTISTSSLTSSVASSSSGSTRRKKLPVGLGSVKGFMKKSISKVEKSMTKLAIKADKGHNPDTYVCGLYDGLGTLLSMTNIISYKDKGSPDVLTFGVPLVLPSAISDDLNSTITIKLWIKSGATLLKNVKNKNYMVGCIHLSVSDLRSALTSKKEAGFLSYDFISSTSQINGVQQQQPTMHLCIVDDNKFPKLMGKGWSITDPDMSGYASGTSRLFNMPLDQSYLFAGRPSMQSSSSPWFVGAERAIESSVVLPIVTAYTKLLKDSCLVSLNHASNVSKNLLANRHDSAEGENATCQMSIGSFVIADPSKQVSSDISLHWQRPDHIFETELLYPSRLTIHSTEGPMPPKDNCSFKVPFYPKICTTDFLGAIRQQYAAQKKPLPPFLLGNVRVQINARVVQSVAQQAQQQPVGTTCDGGISYIDEVWQAVINLDAYANTSGVPQQLKLPIYDTRTRQEMGKLMLYLECKMDPAALQKQQNAQTIPATGGLVSLVGLNGTFADDTQPILDYDEPIPINPNDPNYAAVMQRRQQLQSMGNFITHQYLDQHINAMRSVDFNDINERYQEYCTALQGGGTNNGLPCHQDKTPKPFRPSSSRSTKLLSGIPFNVHNHSLAVDVLQPTNDQQQPSVVAGSLFHNVTCGCPADHARGYGNALSSPDEKTNKTPNSSQHGGQSVTAPGGTSSSAAAGTTGKNTPVGIVQGGLRRIESKRNELNKFLAEAQSSLIQSVGNYLGPLSKYGIHHIPARHVETSNLRWKVFETTQLLHTLTWICSVRRGNVFSQALGIALTSYLASVSDTSRVQAGWPDLWVRFGYLITFEGLLSAAGNELGMIEDASVGISMLRMCQIVLVDATKSGTAGANRVPVPHSPYIKYVEMTTSGKGTYTQFRIEVGLDSIYYEQRIPQPLKNNATVQLYPVLFEVGVDIRQWGKHSITTAKNSATKKDLTCSGVGQVSSSSISVRSAESIAFGSSDGETMTASEHDASGGGLIDDEEDDLGEAHNDVLVTLNYEALQKINTYANMISPPTPEQQQQQQQQQQAAAGQQQQQPMMYPGLRQLQNLIASSANKMQFGILDEASAITKNLGGGSAVFCKSGKDRTAMHCTYKASKSAVNYIHRHQQEQQPTIVQIPGVATPVSNGQQQPPSPEEVYINATTMRIHGTCLPKCEKNVGQAKFAFNALQVKFMPDMLKPPANTLAGFLKGGSIFSGGFIES